MSSTTTASRNHDSLRSMPPAGARSSHRVPRKPLVQSNAPANRTQLRDGSLCPAESKYQDDGCAPLSRINVESRVRAANKLSKALPKLPLARDAVFDSGDKGFMVASPSLALDGDEMTLSRGRRCSTDNAIEFDDVGANSNLGAASTPGQLDATAVSPYKQGLRGVFRNSRESDETASSGHQAGSVHSSAPTSTSSVYGSNDATECSPHQLSPQGSVLDGRQGQIESIPQFHYHHQRDYSPRPSNGNPDAARPSLTPDQLDSTAHGGRHLTPLSGYFGRASQSRPQSSYSLWSENAPRGPSPNLSPRGSHLRAPSLQSRKSPDARPSSYAELLNVPYPQQAPAPLTLDNSNLRSAVGNNASLLSTQKTLDMYRQNVKKTNDFSIQYSFAVFLISTAQELGLDMADAMARKPSPHPPRDLDSSCFTANPFEMVREARQILQRLANGGYPFAQYYLADGFASGLFSKGKEDYNAAFPLFVLAAKHGHAESAYRAALCYEFGWGCRKDPAKAVQFLRLAASKRHPGAMTRLGKACLSGDLGEKRYREGIKWLKLATEAADAQYNNAPYQLGCLYETGYGDDVFEDLSYAAELYTQAAELGHPEANYRMGEAYEHGTLNCPKDAALSVHFYTGAAERGHAAAMMGLCAWYMVGAPPIMDKDEEEAYEWARRSAQLGYAKAQYAVGYFTEMGIGCRRDMLEANVWYVKAADAGDERARQRLAVIQAAASGGGMPMDVAPPRNAKMAKDDKDCVVM
ncbi:hypothetical protein CDD81_3045 [Ophiocordyceps australis]|uniref:Uncharacterized protein n=1 Tax=Ophiocordyceps australis TaxID=1399860 RepID=A0A2C5YHT6_9HYPO|nr:hypothetical protein CDD81_3045 [Ophiocordyceps australis]